MMSGCTQRTEQNPGTGGHQQAGGAGIKALQLSPHLNSVPCAPMHKPMTPRPKNNGTPCGQSAGMHTEGIKRLEQCRQAQD
jgi:hypothetical protein